MTHVIKVYYIPGQRPRFHCSICGDIELPIQHRLVHRVHVRIELAYDYDDDSRYYVYVARCHEQECSGGKTYLTHEGVIRWATNHTNDHNSMLVG